MRIVMFYHSLLSDWNHGNAHFLRGIATELIGRGHQVEVFEPENSWSLQSLIQEHGTGPLRRFQDAYPLLKARHYRFGSESRLAGGVPLRRDLLTRDERERITDTARTIGSSDRSLLPTPVILDLDDALDGADLVIVHEWNAHELVRGIGEHRSRNNYVLLFHDTHHRMVTQPESMAGYDLRHYDGVLAYGEVLRRLYEARGPARRAWTWHEAADTRVFKPIPDIERERDFVWVGNWGDDERTAELHEFLIEPARELRLGARIFGVRYPDAAQSALRDAGIEYGGWLPNFDAPKVFAGFKFTVHVPRRPYVETLPGIPTIRPFEALACGIPLICSPWNDSERLFRPGQDYLVARNGAEMKRQMRAVLNDPSLARDLARNGLETVRQRHTCSHRVDELLDIHEQLTRGAPAIGTARHKGTAARATLEASALHGVSVRVAANRNQPGNARIIA
jgi:spore maturation protein CgeB